MITETAGLIFCGLKKVYFSSAYSSSFKPKQDID